MCTDFIYDIEVYPNAFTLTLISAKSKRTTQYEISERKNDIIKIQKALRLMQKRGDRMVGFNNVSYDYPVLHHLSSLSGDADVSTILASIYHRSTSIIDSFSTNRWGSRVRPSEIIVPQIDLFLIHHFDNQAKATSLKVLEFNMRSDNIGDLPYEPGTCLQPNEIDVLLAYNKHDVLETYKFYLESQEQIHFRETLTKKYNRNFMNHNDGKLGKDYFIMELEDKIHPDVCYTYGPRGRKVQQTKRSSIKLKDVIFDYIHFESPEFNAVKKWLCKQRITETKGVFKKIAFEDAEELLPYCIKSKKYIPDLNVVHQGFKYVFGTGGIHGSMSSGVICSDDEYVIVDLDVTSYYPSVAITNKIYPAHLGVEFCSIYNDVRTDRVSYKKGTAENKMLKEALNNVYGDSNSKYSPFHDPKYTMSITVNGQLMLCMLAEQLGKIRDLQMVQINTDGLTVRLRHQDLHRLHTITKAWEELTGLELEEVIYNRMFVRDVNNYIGEYTSGKLKLKGTYNYNVGWHQNHSALVVRKAVEAHLVHSVDVEEFIRGHKDKYDFCLNTKIPRTSVLYLTDDHSSQPQQRVSRFHMSHSGGFLTKSMPPLKDKTKRRAIAVHKSERVAVCNDIKDFNWKDVRYEWYIKEAYKLIEPLTKNGV